MNKKIILITGATGTIGRKLVLRLLGSGYAVTALVRGVTRARDMLPGAVEIVALSDTAALTRAVDAAYGIINLAGENIAAARWTEARRGQLYASRVGVTTQLASLIRTRATPLPVLVSASAVGIYAGAADGEQAEAAPQGTDFLASLCQAWEAAALAARPNCGRVVLARLGVVLARDGGYAVAMRRLAQVCLAGPVAGGGQWLPWVHVRDVVEALVFALTAAGLDGPCNVVAPEAVTQGGFIAAYAQRLGRRARVPAPAWALKLAMGERAALALASCRVAPRALSAAGFVFTYPRLPQALDALTASEEVAFDRVAEATPDAYRTARKPRYRLTATTTIAAPLDEVFGFFADARNLAAMTPEALGFQIRTAMPLTMREGAEVTYRVALGGLPMGWQTRIDAWEPGQRFVDVQLRGPYRAWWHEHRFWADGDRTVMADTVMYAPPLGPLGWVANRLVVQRLLRQIFGFRADAMAYRFPGRARQRATTPVEEVLRGAS